MFGSTILDAAIALIFIYLLASLVVSAVNEAIAGILRWRANNLANGIRELLQDKDGSGLLERLYQHPLIDGLSQKRPSYIPSRTFALALLDLIVPAKPDGPRTLDDFKAGLRDAPEPLRKSLMVLLDDSQHDLEKLKAAIEGWFNNGMDRVGGWYKRRSQLTQFIAALVLVGFLNIDSVYIAKKLFAVNSPLRDSLVQSANHFASQPGTPEEQMKKATNAISEMTLPIGWQDFDCKERWPICILGWLITAFAVSLGAPFWFDLLNKIINIRAAGKPPDERPKEPKEIPQPQALGGNLNLTTPIGTAKTGGA